MPEDDERWVHPLLRKSAQQQEGEEGGSDAENPPSQDPSSPDSTPPADDAQQQLFDATASEAAPSPYTLSREHLYADLRKLFDEDPHFRNVVKSMTGRATQGEREKQSDAGRLAQLEAELHNARYQQAVAIVQSVDDENEADQLYQSNPDFREAVDWLAENQPVDPRDLNEDRLFYTSVDREFERALQSGLPPDAIDFYKNAMQPGGCKCNLVSEPHGLVDHDASGAPLDYAGSILRLGEIIDHDVTKYHEFVRASAERVAPPAPAANSAPPSAPSAPTPDAPRQTKTQEAASLAEAVRSNPRIGQAVPDVSPGTGARGTGQLTGTEVRGMTVQEILKRWPNPGDFTAAVERGEIIPTEV